MATYFKCADCAGIRSSGVYKIRGHWVGHPAWCNWCQTHKIGGGLMTPDAPPMQPTLKRKPEPSNWNLKRALTLLRASSELPPDAGWECVSKAREILEREVE